MPDIIKMYIADAQIVYKIWKNQQIQRIKINL